MIDYTVTCSGCGCEHSVGLEFENPPSRGDLVARLRSLLGNDGSLVCAQCGELAFAGIEGNLYLASPERIERATVARHLSGQGHLRIGVRDARNAKSAVWRVWLNRKRTDLYLSARSLAGVLKVSLHRDYWYFGFTSEHERRDPDGVAALGGRVQREFESRPGFGRGWVRAFQIVVPSSELSTPESENAADKPVVWIPVRERAEATYLTVCLSHPGASRGRRGFPNEAGYMEVTELVARLPMAEGRTAWIVAHHASLDEGDATLIAGFRKEFLRRVEPPPSGRRSYRLMALTGTSDGGARFFDIAAHHDGS